MTASSRPSPELLALQQAVAGRFLIVPEIGRALVTDCGIAHAVTQATWILGVIAALAAGPAKARLISVFARARALLRVGYSHARVATAVAMDDVEREDERPERVAGMVALPTLAVRTAVRHLGPRAARPIGDS